MTCAKLFVHFINTIPLLLVPSTQTSLYHLCEHHCEAIFADITSLIIASITVRKRLGNMVRKTFVCSSCEREFKELQHMRSHQSRSCSAPIRDNATTADNVINVGGVEEQCGEQHGDGVPEHGPHVNGFDVRQQHESTDGSNSADHYSDEPVVLKSYSILNQIDDRSWVADEVFKFYDSLTQRSERIIDEAPESMLDHVRECHPVVQQFVENCSGISLSRKAIAIIVNMTACYESGLDPEQRIVTKFIPRLSHLHAVLKALRTNRLFTEKSSRTIIDLNDLHGHLDMDIPVNTTGTFRCPLALLKQQVQKNGTWSIQSYRRSYDDNGNRTFSCPCDSYAMQSYSEQVGEKGVVVTAW